MKGECRREQFGNSTLPERGEKSLDLTECVITFPSISHRPTHTHTDTVLLSYQPHPTPIPHHHSCPFKYQASLQNGALKPAEEGVFEKEINKKAWKRGERDRESNKSTWSMPHSDPMEEHTYNHLDISIIAHFNRIVVVLQISLCICLCQSSSQTCTYSCLLARRWKFQPLHRNNRSTLWLVVHMYEAVKKVKSVASSRIP